jgi:hypothetical protein
MLGPLLGAPTDVLAADDLARRGAGVDVPVDARRDGETLEAWRGRIRGLIARGGAVEPPSAGVEAPRPARATRAARQHAAAAMLARAALLQIDLSQPDDALRVVAALGGRRGASGEVVDAAARLLARALATPVIARARGASWLARDVPVAADVGRVVVEERLDMLFEEQGGLVAVRVPTPGAGVSPGLSSEALAAGLGRPIREVLVLDLGDV